MKTRSFVLRAMLSVIVAGVSNLAAADSGEQVFQSNCAVCHQPQAQGMPGLAPPLKGSRWSKFTGQRAYVPGVLLAGMNGSLPMEGDNFIGVMPTQNRLSDEDIAAVANYLFKTVNGQSDWQALTAAEIADMRKSTPSVSSLRALRKQALAQ